MPVLPMQVNVPVQIQRLWKWPVVLSGMYFWNVLILINYQFYNFLQLKKLTIFFQMVLSSDQWQP